MCVDIRWIVLVSLVAAAVVAALVQPEWIAPLTLGVAVAGVLYLILQLGPPATPLRRHRHRVEHPDE